ncbi:hypothetical protein B0J12DRAFT_197100 [Macrophomina phaseolina]|uniref:Uncharacterized protein n=1 Tax=Macrophomina phaseolina TaxID=35725 RepID=A0ABQ8G2Y2_9PEZI|nr:hypothetical protein B0J12DRAFT_197100 [Macrophomina phaseolina]
MRPRSTSRTESLKEQNAVAHQLGNLLVPSASLEPGSWADKRGRQELHDAQWLSGSVPARVTRYFKSPALATMSCDVSLASSLRRANNALSGLECLNVGIREASLLRAAARPPASPPVAGQVARFLADLRAWMESTAGHGDGLSRPVLGRLGVQTRICRTSRCTNKIPDRELASNVRASSRGNLADPQGWGSGSGMVSAVAPPSNLKREAFLLNVTAMLHATRLTSRPAESPYLGDATLSEHAAAIDRHGTEADGA